MWRSRARSRRSILQAGAGNERSVVLLAGPPGAGKTMTAAKLAARTVLAGGRVRLVSADAARAGAIGQLPLSPASSTCRSIRRDEAALRALAAGGEAAELLAHRHGGRQPAISAEDCASCAAHRASAAEPLMVLPAGGDAVDMVEMVRTFARLGCSASPSRGSMSRAGWAASSPPPMRRGSPSPRPASPARHRRRAQLLQSRPPRPPAACHSRRGAAALA